MTTLFRPRQRAEEFAARVDAPVSPLRAVRSGSGAGERETDRLVGVVTTLRRQAEAHGAAVPRAAFAAELRERLLAEATVALTPHQAALTLPPRTRSRTERRLVAAASAMVLLGGTAGMAAAAQNALPGEALYPIKRGIEKAEAGLATTSVGRGRDLLTQASGRLDEVQGLLADRATSGAAQVSGTLAAFSAQAREGADLMMTSYTDGSDRDTIRTLREFAAHDLGSLEALSGTAPPQADPGLQKAVMTLRAIDAEATSLCATCADLPALKVPKVFLASAEADRAMKAIESTPLGNDHPVVVDKQQVRQANRASGGTKRLTRSGTATSGPAPSGPAAGTATVPRSKAPDAPKADSPARLPGSAPTTLPKLGLPAKVPPAGSGLDTGLGAAAGTLLPEVEVPPLP